MTGSLYIPDTSALIAAWEERYPLDIFPSVWEFLDGLNGRLRICKEVRDEISRHSPELLAWLDDSSIDANLSLLSDGGAIADAVQQQVRRIANGWPNWGAVRVSGRADPWVIAYALALGGIVVSEEQSGRRDTTIPKVCDETEARHMNLLDLFRAEGFGP